MREDVLYTNHKGDEKRGIRKRAEKAIDQLQDALRKVLEAEEAVLYVARAQLPASPFEQFVLGWLAVITEHGLLVFTNRRLLFFLVKRNGTWKRSVRSVRWGDVEEARAKGFLGRILTIRYKDGTKEKYWRLRGDDARKIKALLAAITQAAPGESTPMMRMAHLCPNCSTPLTDSNYKCAKCGLDFKTEKSMARRAWLFPGGGYLYAGHPGLAVLDFLIEAFILVEIVLMIGIAAGLITLKPTPGEAPTTPGTAAGIFALFWVFKKYATTRHCRRFIREFIPVQQA